MPRDRCTARPAQNASAESLPAFTADAQQVFDDGIDPHAVGLELEYGNPRTDPRVRTRAQTSDIVLRADAVTTVTGPPGKAGASTRITMKSVERLGGKHPVGDEFTVNVNKTSPSLGIGEEHGRAARRQSVRDVPEGIAARTASASCTFTPRQTTRTSSRP